MEVTAKPMILIVLDGWGHSDDPKHNAILQAKIPTWQKLWATCPHTLLAASGPDVGLPAGQMGNSEVGHMTIGAGRIIYQDLVRINNAIADGSFFENPVLLKACATAAQRGAALHILGLLSPGGVHSHEAHIAALIKMAKQNNVSKIYLHAFLDGRDTPPQSAVQSLIALQPYVVDITGRFYAMDRDNRTERTQTAVDLLISGRAAFSADDPLQALNQAYERGETDEFVQATIIKAAPIQPDDVVICANFRTDRARQICHALIKTMPQIAKSFVTMTEYDAALPVQVAFPPNKNVDTLSAVIAAHNLTQLHIAETEKYAHVTFFFNAGSEAAVPGEERIMIPSPKVATYDLQPAMHAQLITDAILGSIANKKYDVIICNFANADMVGHTGILAATIVAIETIDACLGQIVDAVQKSGGSILITADHGNAETMWDDATAQPNTAHTTNLVPLIYVGPRNITLKADKIYGLQDIAPTMLKLLNIAKPTAMTGTSLIASET